MSLNKRKIVELWFNLFCEKFVNSEELRELRKTVVNDKANYKLLMCQRIESKQEQVLDMPLIDKNSVPLPKNVTFDEILRILECMPFTYKINNHNSILNGYVIALGNYSDYVHLNTIDMPFIMHYTAGFSIEIYKPSGKCIIL